MFERLNNRNMTNREKALKTYKEQIATGMQDTPMNWHIWKKAYDEALKQSENVVLDGVSNCDLCNGTGYISIDNNIVECHSC